MNKTRMEAFSDGVMAVIITIMVLELKAPSTSNEEALTPLLHEFLSYVLSFMYVAIYWNNHHHLLNTISKVTGSILWANLHLLFWLSLVPFATSWATNTGFDGISVAFYGFDLLMCGYAYDRLSRVIICHHGADSLLAKAVGRDWKGKVSLICYLIGVVVAFFQPMISCALYIAVAIMWIVPDPRIEKVLTP